HPAGYGEPLCAGRRNLDRGDHSQLSDRQFVDVDSDRREHIRRGPDDEKLSPMTPRRALTAGLVLAAAAATASPAFSHPGGSTGFAAIVIGRNRIRYSLMLWPATMPPAVAEDLRLTRAGHVASRDRLLGVIRDKVTLVAQGKRCEAGPGLLLPPAPRGESVTFVVDFTCAEAVSDLLIRDDLFDVLGADYHTLARFEAPGFSGQFAFTPETRETRVTLAGAGEGGRGTVSF